MYDKVFEILPVALVGALLAGAVYTDLRYGKIYNKMTIPCMMAGIVVSLAAHGPAGVLQSLAGMGLILALFLLFAPVMGIGGGDVKLMMAIGAVMGISFVIWALLYSAIFGGLMALLVMARYRILGSATRNLATNLYMKMMLRVPIDMTSGSSGIKFRYSPAIALGTIVTFLFKL